MGLFLQAYGAEVVLLDHQRTSQALYLHETARRVPLSEEETAGQEPRPEKLAVGGEGGFQLDQPK